MNWGFYYNSVKWRVLQNKKVEFHHVDSKVMPQIRDVIGLLCSDKTTFAFMSYKKDSDKFEQVLKNIQNYVKWGIRDVLK